MITCTNLGSQNEQIAEKNIIKRALVFATTDSHAWMPKRAVILNTEVFDLDKTFPEANMVLTRFGEFEMGQKI